MKLSLKGREIPRNKVGDPSFKVSTVSLEDWALDLLQVFSPEEIVELVNRSLYQLEYQARAHEKRRIERELLERPIKDMFYSLYPKQSYAKATDDQLEHCIRELRSKT